MSKGLGRVELQLRSVCLDEPPDFFPTTMLCQRIYGISNVEKKHRVAVLRGMKSLAERGEVNIWRLKLKREKSDDEWFNGNRISAPRHSSPLRNRAKPKRSYG